MDGLMKLEIPGGKLCLLRLDAVDDAQLARWETWLDPEKRARIGRQDAQHRRQTVCAFRPVDDVGNVGRVDIKIVAEVVNLFFKTDCHLLLLFLLFFPLAGGLLDLNDRLISARSVH